MTSPRPKRMGLAFIAALVALTPTRLLAAPPSPRPALAGVFALIVANNESLDPAVRRLQYADDDAARFHELMAALRANVRVLTVPDAETQRTFPGLAAVARPPTREALRRAMGELRDLMLEARKAGASTTFYFYFAGHGDVGSDREGFVHLLDGRFTRSDLFREVVGRSPADRNHVIIDACNSYFVVNARGHGHLKAIRGFLTQESLDRYPNTGVVLSTATAAESHEWARYRSGIFSHQLLSGLLGGADVDGDGRIRYQELAAYVAAANLKVRDPRARVSIFARAPRADLRAPLLDLGLLARLRGDAARPAHGRVAGLLRLPAAFQGHWYLEDDRGVRYADFNKTAEHALALALLDRPFYYLRNDAQEARVALDGPGDVDGAALQLAPLPLASRGSVEESFRQDLYAVPFGRNFAQGHAAAETTEDDEPGPAIAADVPVLAARPWWGRLATWKWTTAAITVAGLATGITLQVLAANNADKLDRSGALTWREAQDLQSRVGWQRAGSGIALGIAGTAAATAIVLFLLDRDGPRSSPPPGAPANGARVAGTVLPNGGGLTLQSAF
jgi:hypothetical protein